MKVILYFYLFLYLHSIVIAQEASMQPTDNILKYRNTIEGWLDASDSLKIEMIKHLLTKKGNQRKNEVWFGYTNEEEQHLSEAMSASRIYHYHAATNQFVALYLISALYYADLEFCKKVEITYKEKHTTTNLKKTRRNKHRVEHSNIIRKMYCEYEAWFQNINGFSLSEIPPPLEDSKFRWD